MLQLTFSSGKPKFEATPGLAADNVGQIVKANYVGAANDNRETVANQEGFQSPQVKQYNIPYTSADP